MNWFMAQEACCGEQKHSLMEKLIELKMGRGEVHLLP